MRRLQADAIGVTIVLMLMSYLAVAAAVAGALFLAIGAQVVALVCAWILGKLMEMDAQIEILERRDRSERKER